MTTPRVGLFDFEGHQQLVDALCEVCGREATDVQERLVEEALLTGWNVSRAAREAGLRPHVYDEAMERFYHETDAFVFELAVIHQNRYCQEIDRRISDELAARFPESAGVQVLVLGDGIGTDALRLALAGYTVTYFEFEGFSAELAKRRFQRAGMEGKITVLHQLGEIPAGRYDAVVNREVLEHVTDPEEVIRDIWRYLKPGGVALVTESFGKIEPEFPTHLLENARFAGHTPRLFVEAGFRLVRIGPEGRPLVFQRTTLDDAERFRTLPRERRFGLRRIARRLLRPLRALRSSTP